MPISKYHFLDAEIIVSIYKETRIVSSAANIFIFLTLSNMSLPFDVCVYRTVCMHGASVHCCIVDFELQFQKF